MTSRSSVRTLDVRHLQLARALFAAVAAVMVTFSSDHSAAVGLSIFSGFAISTALVFTLAAWLIFPRGGRAVPVLLALTAGAAGVASAVGAWRSTALFFAVAISWALLSGLIELIGAVRARRAGRSEAAPRDGVVVGILTLVLGLVLLFTPTQYALDYYIADAGRTFTLTGITIAVGLFGGYAAIVAVYLAIAGLSPRRPVAAPVASTEEAAS